MQESSGSISGSDSSEVDDNNKPIKTLSSSCLQNPSVPPNVEISEENDSPAALRETTPLPSSLSRPVDHSMLACIQKSTTISNGLGHGVRNRSTWGRTAVSKY